MLLVATILVGMGRPSNDCCPETLSCTLTHVATVLEWQEEGSMVSNGLPTT